MIIALSRFTVAIDLVEAARAAFLDRLHCVHVSTRPAE
jgi:hypothetical protein